MASLNTIYPRALSPLSKPLKPTTSGTPLSFNFSLTQWPTLSTIRSRRLHLSAAAKELDVLPVQSPERMDHPDMGVPMTEGREASERELMGGPMVGGFEGRLSLEGVAGGNINSEVSSGGGGGGSRQGNDKKGEEDSVKPIDRVINATIVLAAGSFAITKLLTIDHEYWHGWTLYEILRYAPQHNWTAYEEILKTNPVFAKMVISGVVYSLGDWIAQCYEGKPLFDFDRGRMFRSGLTGFCLHGSLSHFYYEFCEALFPFQDWWVVPLKVAFDQTVWSAVWNSIYYTVLGLLRFESPASIFNELKATFWPMLTAGWKLWPFAHLVTYGVIPVEQRLLWVDCVELVWVTILSTYSNEKSEARISEASAESIGSRKPPEEQ